MFGYSDRFGRIEQKLKYLEGLIDAMGRDLARMPSEDHVKLWDDELEADLRVEIILLAKALGYVREVGGPKYRKAK